MNLDFIFNNSLWGDVEPAETVRSNAFSGTNRLPRRKNRDPETKITAIGGLSYLEREPTH